ncbi:hypothetical protein E4U54_002207 [Claviceps lovelessii]|nr:hypothetical protein E4U54_002207 [Claviceps lovelessii]
MSTTPSYKDLVACQTALFEWAESYDTKDWDRLSRCIAPTLHVDYRAILGQLWESMPAHDFVRMISNPRFLGNPLIKTQHSVGASRWRQTGEETITGHHQMRVAHQKYAGAQRKEVILKGHGHGAATTWYRKVDGEWKFAGIEPEIRWAEFDLDKMFEE